MDVGWWVGARVLLTGHTGFKGAWMSLLLHRLGAEVHGYALDPRRNCLYERCDVPKILASDTRADIRNRPTLGAAVQDVRPDVVMHFAAQSVVADGYADPRTTFDTNIMGTFEVLDTLRWLDHDVRCVVVTTDKVYRNAEWEWGYREDEPLGGDDPYSASKAGTEIVAHAMRVSFPRPGLEIATARAGNVLGGGDTTPAALVPELITALAEGRPPELRHPRAIRPWQHVLEPLGGYLTLAQALEPGLDHRAWNFGPSLDDVLTVGEVATIAAEAWGGANGWVSSMGEFHESQQLALDSTRARRLLGWKPTTDTRTAVRLTVEWEREVGRGRGPLDVTLAQIDAFIDRSRNGGPTFG